MSLFAFLKKLFRWLADLFRPAPFTGPPDPTGEVRFIIVKESDDMADKLIGTLQLPEVPTGKDIEQQEVKLFVDGVETSTFLVDKATREIPSVEVPQDSLVRIELRYVDDADPPNRSQNPLVAQQQVRDTFAPPDPTGTIGLLITAEVDEDAEAEAEAPAEEPATEAPVTEPVAEAPVADVPPPPAEAATDEAAEEASTEEVADEAIAGSVEEANETAAPADDASESNPLPPAA